MKTNFTAKVLATMITAMLLVSSPAPAQSPGRALAELTFDSIEGARKGYLDQGDLEATRKNIFASMDADDSKSLDLSEFLEWGYGFENLAKGSDRLLAYQTALKVVFSFWDINGDGKITTTEHRKSSIRDFNRADLNNDAVLSRDEFLHGFSVLVAIKAALKPE